MEDTIQSLKDAKGKINDAVQKVKEQDDFSSKAFVEIVQNIYEDIEKDVRIKLHMRRKHH